MPTNTTAEIHANAHETNSVFGWDWPDEARLAEFAEETARAEKVNRLEQADPFVENIAEYAALYFVS
jgi:hypothetical protein